MFFLVIFLVFFLMHLMVILWFYQNTAGLTLSSFTKFLPLILTTVYVLLYILARNFDIWILEKILLIYLGALFLAFALVFVLVIFNFLLKLLHLNLPFKLGIPALTVWTVIVLISLLTATKKPTIKTINLQTPVLTENKKIAFISDTHFGATVSTKRAESLSKILEKENPDLILFGGDIFETDLQNSKPYIEILAKISPNKKFGVLGNHEYYVGLENERASFSKAGIYLLENKSHNFEGINIIGVNDIKTAKINKQELENILEKEIKPDTFNILLTHTPIYFKEAAKTGVNLMLSGHTHNGQIFPFNFLVRLTTPYMYGQFKDGNSNLIVTSGTFFWGPPMRLFSNNEIVIINLQGQQK